MFTLSQITAYSSKVFQGEKLNELRLLILSSQHVGNMQFDDNNGTSS